MSPASRTAPLLLALGCVGRTPPVVAPAPGPRLEFEVVGNASPADTGAPTLQVRGATVIIRGLAVQQDGAGLYGDLDLSEPHTLRLTLYDSLSGRPVDDPLPPAPPSAYRQVLYEARIGPVPPGGYEVWVGRFNARARLVEVAHQPLHIEIDSDPETELAGLGAMPPELEPLPDGGRITVRGAPGGPDRGRAIRRVLERVAAAYTRGDYRWPRAPDGEPPGARSLAEQGGRVGYRVEPVPGGGVLRIRAASAESIAAVHEFLAARAPQGRPGTGE